MSLLVVVGLFSSLVFGSPEKRFSQALQFKTVSMKDEAKDDPAAFVGFAEFVKKSFPLVHQKLKREMVGHSMLFTWEGADPTLKPIILLSHFDVVPAAADKWQYPPFSGALEGGFIWGRGALDDKSSVMAILEAAEKKIADGFNPLRTIYFAFGHDEEIGGKKGAKAIADILKKREVMAEFAIDEGGVILQPPQIGGVDKPVAMVGIAEKGYLTIELTTESPGGHSSMPPNEMAIAKLANVIQKINDNPFPTKIPEPTRFFLDSIAPHASFPNNLALSNLSIFGPIVRWQMAKGRSSQALVRTTTAITMARAGLQDNVLPRSATVTVNFRILPGETSQGTIDYIKKVLKDDTVKIKKVLSMEPSPVSSIKAPGFDLIKKTVTKNFSDTIVAPYIVVGATDIRHFKEVSENRYRFLPLRFTKEDMARFHGVDERISVSGYKNAISFYSDILSY